MNWEIIFVFLLLVATFASFVWEKVSTDLTAIAAFAILMLAGALPFAELLPGPSALIEVFANSAPLTIAAMFMLSAALERCGAIEVMAGKLEQLASLGARIVMLLMMLGVGFISAFINNTPVVVIFLPVVLSLARSLSVAPSKMLIPLSYASIFGGTCTLVGTSSNILASGILKEAGRPPLSMFELIAVGLPLLMLGIAYLLLFGRRLLPDRESLMSILSDAERKEYFTEAYVKPNSDLIGKSPVESGLVSGGRVRVLELIRNEVAVSGDLRNTQLLAGDRLILACRPSGFAQARSVEGLNLGAEESLGLSTIAAHEGAIVEGIIGPRSSIIGRTVKEIQFRQRFRMILLAIHRNGINLREKLETVPLQTGDTILMMGTDQACEELRKSDDIFLLDRPATSPKNLRKKMPIVLGIMVAVVGSVTLGWLPIVAAAILGVAVALLTGCLSSKEAYASVDWSILVLIYGMLGVGLAMETTGASSLIAEMVLAMADMGLPPEWQPLFVLALLYVCTSVMTEMLSNQATVVLMTPIAIQVGLQAGIDPRPLVIGICVAGSASFSTPIGYQTNTYVYGVGGYRFTDFLRVGTPLNVLYFVGSMCLIPLFWDF